MGRSLRTLHIEAKDLQDGDVWVSENARLEVQTTSWQRGFFVPWSAGRDTPPVEMGAVRIVGNLTRNDVGRPFHWQWVVQEDTPMEVERMVDV